MIIRYEDVNDLPTLKIDTEEPVAPVDTEDIALHLSVTTHMRMFSDTTRSQNVFVGMTMVDLIHIRAVIDSIITIKNSNTDEQE